MSADPQPENPLAPELYDALRNLAGRLFSGERGDHTLQPTALVHEAWLRVGASHGEAQDQRAFLALVARTMRNLLVDHARRRRAEKRGGGRARHTWVDALALVEREELDLLDLEVALQNLEQKDSELARVVELRYFGGLTLEETAGSMQLSLKQVRNAWDLARAILKRELGAAE